MVGLHIMSPDESQAFMERVFGIQCDGTSPLVQLKVQAVTLDRVHLLLGTIERTIGALEQLSSDRYKESLPSAGALDEFANFAREIYTSFKGGLDPLFVTEKASLALSAVCGEAKAFMNHFLAEVDQSVQVSKDALERRTRRFEWRELQFWLNGWKQRKDPMVQQGLDQIQAAAEHCRVNLNQAKESVNTLRARVVATLKELERLCNQHGELSGPNALVILGELSEGCAKSESCAKECSHA